MLPPPLVEYYTYWFVDAFNEETFELPLVVDVSA